MLNRFGFGRIAKIENINICRETETITKDEQDITIEDAFIVVFTKDNLLNKENINPLFQHVRGNTYRAILDPKAGLADITAFGNAIRELDCAKMVDKEYKKLVTHSVKEFAIKDTICVAATKENFTTTDIPNKFKKKANGDYSISVNVNDGLFALTDFGNAISKLKEADSLFATLNAKIDVEAYTPPRYIMT